MNLDHNDMEAHLIISDCAEF